MSKIFCCYVSGKGHCDFTAEWLIVYGSSPEDYTNSCTPHVGELLTDAKEHRIYPLEVVTSNQGESRHCRTARAAMSAEKPNAERLLREHNYFYQDQFGDVKTGFYYCLCGWEGPDRDSYWKHLEALQSISSAAGRPALEKLQELEAKPLSDEACDKLLEDIAEDECEIERLKKSLETIAALPLGHHDAQKIARAVLAEFEKEGK